MTTSQLSLVSTQTATTYCFRDEFGWANCTVNDATGELSIQSDWGSWSHRWSPDPDHLGAPTLTVFIGTRGDVDYLARKLQREGHARRWSAEATARVLCRRLCERRLETKQTPEDHALRKVVLPVLIAACATPEVPSPASGDGRFGEIRRAISAFHAGPTDNPIAAHATIAAIARIIETPEAAAKIASSHGE